MRDKYFVVDTNALINHIQNLREYKKVLLTHILRELEKCKKSNNPYLAYKARVASRYIKDHEDEFVFDGKTYDGSEIGDRYYEDNNIIKACIENNYGLITGDVLLRFQAKAYNIDVIDIDEINKHAKGYTGIRKLYFSDSLEDQEILAKIYVGDISFLDLNINEYLIIYVNNKPVDKLRYDGNKLVKLKLPPKSIIQAKNEEQECAIDLLNNKEIPIKFILGEFGSGKSYLTVKMSLYKVIDKGEHSKILVVRNPIGSGEEIGFLKGTKDDKTQDFFKPFVQHLEGGEQEAHYLEQRGQLMKDIPFYMKGLDIQDTFIVVDEAEDLDRKIIKMLGTRVSEGSVIVFCGDYNQAEEKFKYNNGLKFAVEELKGHPLVGIVKLSEDVRSEASKVFAKLI